MIRTVAATLSFLVCCVVSAQTSPPGGSGGSGDSGFSPVSIGHGWYVVNVEPLVTETITEESSSGTNIWTRTTIGSDNGWYLNGQPTNLSPLSPAFANIHAEWKIEGTYKFSFEYQGTDSPPYTGFPIQLYSRGKFSFNNDPQNYTVGTGDASACFGAPITIDDGLSSLTYGYKSEATDVLFFNAKGTTATYQTPKFFARAYADGPNAGAYAELACSIAPSDKTIAAWLNPEPTYKPDVQGNYLISIQLPNSDVSEWQIATVPNYVRVPVQPTSIGIDRYHIEPQIGRKIEHNTKYRGSDDEIHDSNPGVPTTIQVTYGSGAYPQSNDINWPDSFQWDSSPIHFLPPDSITPGYGSYTADYIEEDLVHQTTNSYFEGDQTRTNEFHFNWHDGVRGTAIVDTTMSNKYVVVYNIGYYPYVAELLPWEDLGGHNEAGSDSVDVPISYTGSVVQMASGTLVAAAAFSGNPYFAGAASLIGLSSIFVQNETVKISPQKDDPYKVWPEDWYNVVANGQQDNFWASRGLFRWQAQIKKGYNAYADYCQIFDESGFNHMEVRFRMDRDPLMGRKRYLFWLADYEGSIPDAWWSN